MWTEFVKILLDNEKLIMIIGGGLTSFIMIFGHIKKIVCPIIKGYCERLKAKQEMPLMVKDMANIVKNIDERVARVEKEITPNGGSSMKDAMRIIKAEIEAANWLHPRPTFRVTSTGLVTFVNEAYCNLCGASTEELMRLGWKNYMVDPECGDHTLGRFQESTKEFSQFVENIRYKNNNGEYIGEWKAKVKPLGPIEHDTNNYLWHGTLYPIDKVALEYANKYNIPKN
jgi:PAS domain-containing protein